MERKSHNYHNCIRRIREKNKKLRSLVEKKEINENPSKINVDKIIFITSLLILLSGVVLYKLRFGSCEFWAAYDRNYASYVYGDQFFCKRIINTEDLNEKLKSQIIGQDDSLRLIKGSLDLANQHSYFIQMIFHGTSGIGKTFSTEIVADNFPWKRNIQKYIWDFYTTEEILRLTKAKLSKCGFNLIIIDDISLNNDAISFLKEFEVKIREQSKRDRLRVVLINIFKGTLDELQKQQLSNFVIVDFKSLTKNDFIQCIELHQQNFNIALDKNSLEFNELLEINYTASGCKQISKRLNLVANKYNNKV